MSTILISVVAFVVALGALIAIHEFGHFWVARRMGIKVLRYSIGFGRPVWRRDGADGTEYVIGALPLGGYVRMLDSREGEVPEDLRNQAFDTQPVRKRMAVVVAGPAFNFVFAIFAYWLMFVLGVPGTAPVVGEVRADSPAAYAGLEEGDRILEVGGKDTPTWQAVTLAMLEEVLDDASIAMTVRTPAGGRQAVVLDVRGMERSLTEREALFDGLGITPMAPTIPPILGQPEPGSPAEDAGIQDGDRVVRIDGEAVDSFSSLVRAIRERPDQAVEMVAVRDGRELTLQLQVGSQETDGRIIGRIGVPAAEAALAVLDEFRAEQRFSPLAAVGESARQTAEMSLLTLRMLWRMLTGDVSIRNISGPIDIAQYAGMTASIGLVPFLSFLAIISISLGVLNLLPIPVLDGGQLMFQFVELLKGSPVSPKTEMVGQQVGIFMLLLLMSFAFYNDISRLLG